MLPAMSKAPFVKLESSPNNVEDYDIKSLEYQSITIVPPERRD